MPETKSNGKEAPNPNINDNKSLNSNSDSEQAIAAHYEQTSIIIPKVSKKDENADYINWQIYINYNGITVQKGCEKNYCFSKYAPVNGFKCKVFIEEF